MRATVRNLLVANGTLTGLVPTERWFQAGNVVDVPPKPFVILRWLAPVSGDAQGTFAKQLRLEVYDNRPGSYKRIDDVLGNQHLGTGVYGVLSTVMDHAGADGYVAQADYIGQSGDEVDVDLKANMKFSSWQIIGRSL